MAVNAIQPGVPVGIIKLGGIEQPWNPPPAPGSLPVFIASDSEGWFGHNCLRCGAIGEAILGRMPALLSALVRRPEFPFRGPSRIYSTELRITRRRASSGEG